MENDNFLRRNLPTILWIAVLASIYFVFSALITPFVSGITLNSAIVTDRLKEIGSFLFGILGGLAIIEIYFYQIFFREPTNRTATIVTRGIQIALGVLTLIVIISFFNTTDLIKLGESAFGKLASARKPFTNLKASLIKSKVATKDLGTMIAGIIFAIGILALYAVIQLISKPQNSPSGLAYLNSASLYRRAFPHYLPIPF